MLIVLGNFHVYVGDLKVAFSRGMVIDPANMPEGQSAGDWIAKGLARAEGAGAPRRETAAS